MIARYHAALLVESERAKNSVRKSPKKKKRAEESKEEE
jgi:hypothetical protein